MTAPPPAPPGWYPDPSGAKGKRYWDGNTWHDAIPANAKLGGVNWPLAIIIGVVVLGLGAACIAGKTMNKSVHRPIPPGASSEDIAFLSAMDSHGITNQKGPQAEINLAYDICNLLNGGMSLNGLAEHHSLTSGSDMSGDDMHYFIETATATYCPQHVH
jgi:hypothetical protein